MSTTAELIAAIPSALKSQDPEMIGPLLAEDVIWDVCRGRDAVLGEIRSAQNAGLDFTEAVITELDDRLVVDLVLPDEMGAIHLAVFHSGGLIEEVRVVDINSHEDAVAATRLATPDRPSKRARFESVAAIFPVNDTKVAMELYQRLGFDVHSYDGGDFYAFAERDSVHLHLAKVDDVDPLTNMSAAYLYVSDAHALHAEWANAGVSGRLHTPENTDYGMVEGAYTDPDGNLLRFGSAS